MKYLILIVAGLIVTGAGIQRYSEYGFYWESKPQWALDSNKFQEMFESSCLSRISSINSREYLWKLSGCKNHIREISKFCIANCLEGSKQKPFIKPNWR